MPGSRKRDRGGGRGLSRRGSRGGSRGASRGGSWLGAAVGLGACGALAASALVTVFRNELALRVLLAQWFDPIAAGLALGVLANAAALALLLWRRRMPPPAWRPRLALRVVAYALLGAAVAYLIWLQPYRSLVAHVCFGLAAGLPGLAALCGEWLLLRLPRPLVSLVDLLLFVACLVFVGGELSLRALASYSDSPLFARSSESMLDFMARYRLRPDQASPGFPVNAQGHFDVEFGARTPGVPRAVTIGDSFSTSVVPHHYHFTTVAERALERGEVCNLGIAAMGLNEYLYVLRQEALPLKPDAIVVNVFIGNDLIDNLGGYAAPTWLESWLDQDGLLLYVVPKRKLALAHDQQGGMRPVGSPVRQPAGDPLDLDRLYPWLADPSREIPTFVPERFADVERHRAQSVCRADAPPDWPRIFELLGEMRSAAGSTPFAVMLIPDEFQVEDDVWALVTGGPEGERLDRDLPQRVLGAWLAEQGIPCLDLLPALRAVEPMSDGKRHLYQLRDTHFNARGNAVAGEQLAEFLRRWWG